MKAYTDTNRNSIGQTTSSMAIDDCTQMLCLPVTRYRFRFLEKPTQGQPSLLNNQTEYLGSAWRGVLGHALRNAVCITRQPVCDNCALLGSCPYPNIFENRTPSDAKKLSRYPLTPSPYVLEPSMREFDSKDSSLNLGVTLFGTSNDYFPYLVHAFQVAGKHGLTSRRIELELVDIEVESFSKNEATPNVTSGWSVSIFSRKPLTPGESISDWNPPELPNKFRIRLITPLRIKAGGRFVNPTQFNFRAFASNLLRRISLLTYFFSETPLELDYAAILKKAEEVPILNADLHWHDWTRHSSRQQTKLLMGGLLGNFEVQSNDIEDFWPYIWLGQWLHAGKGCTMGLGRYVIEPQFEASHPAEKQAIPFGPCQL